MRARRTLRKGIGPALVLCGVAWGLWSSEVREDSTLVLVPSVVGGVRERTPVESKLFLYNPSLRPQVRLREVRVTSELGFFHAQELSETLVADRRLGELGAMLELLPPELTERPRGPRYFAPESEPELRGSAAMNTWLRAQELQTALQHGFQVASTRGEPLPCVEITLPIPMDQVFLADDPAGTERRLRFEVDFEGADGVARTASVETTVRRLERWPTGELALTLPGYEIHRGDMHVHSCYGEPVIPCSILSGLCLTESAQLLTGSYTYAQLKASYEAQSVDWFTATDHSYCVSTESTYASVVADCAAITTPTFVAIPDIELSSLEEGPQTGSDSFGDAACAFLANANHMGAHGIIAYQPGGLPIPAIPPGFCVGLNGFTANAAIIRSEGGYAVINHPTSDSPWAWNSLASMHGIEGSQMHGCEIWGGEDPFANHLLAWVDFLKAGRILYAYGGSDLHDDVPANWGVNHVLLTELTPFTSANLQAAIRAGRVFVSNGPCAILEVVFGGAPLLMGTLRGLPPTQPPANVDVRVHYDFGVGNSGSVSVWHGTVGGNEGLVGSSLVTGSGTFVVQHSLTLGAPSWYRAEASRPGATPLPLNAYTNPVFFIECGVNPYGAGVGGANVGSLTSPTIPESGTTIALVIAGLSPLPAVPGFLAISRQPLAPSPLLGGFLLVHPLGWSLLPLNVVGGTALVQITIAPNPALAGKKFYGQAAALNPGLPQPLTFTNGLELVFCQ
jgi:hypothetical protein